jgi:hypothetical protein
MAAQTLIGQGGLVSTSTLIGRVPHRGRLAVIAVSVVALVGAGALLASRALPVTAPGPEPAVALEPPRFEDVAVAAGVEHAYDGDFAYFVGGGVAAFDCDDDGLPDLYVAGGANRAALFRNRSGVGALRFERTSGVETDLEDVTGAYPMDIDGDRLVDLAVLRHDEDVVLRGLGDCRFERANEKLGLGGDAAWTVAFSATWEGTHAALPTLAFGDYLVLDDEGMWTGECAEGRLIRPAPGGTSYGEPIALRPSWCTLSMLFSDWDRSGRRDLRVSNDRHYYRDGEEQLWRIEPGQPPGQYTRDDGWERLRIWGMGVASEDVTGDAYPEVYLTSQGDNKLQTLIDGGSRPTYRDIALRRGVTAHRPFAGGETLASTAWHPAFEDVNNDGFTDLYVAKGNVESQTEYASKDPSNLFIGQADGTFVEGAVAAGIVDYARARGAALVDLDLDGMLDLVQVVRRENVRIWHNLGAGEREEPEAMGHWLAVDIDQPAPNHDAIGAWVAVRAGGLEREREVSVGGGHASGQLVPLHFGLGSAESAEVRVTWPDGEVGPWLPVEADQVVRVERGAPAAQPLAP